MQDDEIAAVLVQRARMARLASLAACDKRWYELAREYTDEADRLMAEANELQTRHASHLLLERTRMVGT